MDAYREAARQRHIAEKAQLRERRQRAWDLARQAARLLEEHFNAKRVVLFGSLAHEDRFNPWSDVDIAAWGLRPEDTWRALGAVMDLDPDIEVNLVDIACCRPNLRAVIEREGIDL
ncbi:MAG: nucleotidyltransferase domain-containing protein [Gemmatimonadota bacterium]|nr:nucleotidyltransferase domain-containing protein [Gemmatimonadota bacterium]